MRWTAEQARAITETGDTLLVANAGTGKTTTVVGKVLWLLGLDVGVDRSTGEPVPRCPDPCELHEIAAITFTEKAAYDLKRKLRAEVVRSERGEALRWDVDRASVGTIHAFAGALLREHALRLGVDPAFHVLDEAETRQEVEDIVREVVLEALEAGDGEVGELFRDRGLRGYRGSGLIPLVGGALRDIRWRPEHFERWSEADGALSSERLRGACEEWTAPDDLPVRSCSALYRLARRANERWAAALERENARDFDALILDARRLLHQEAGRAAVDELRRRFRIVIVDEFQDTDRAQRDIVHRIAGGVARPQLFLVGDPKQSIYRFRGADISVWNEVEGEMRQGGGRVLPLTQNFRSTRAVVDYANRTGRLAIEEAGEALAAESPEGRIGYSDLEVGRTDADGGAVEWLTATAKGAEERRRAEARAVVARIQEMVGSVVIADPDTGDERTLEHRDVALLYRTGTGIHCYEDVFAEHGVPFHDAQPAELGDRQEVADLVNALRLVENPRDDMRAFGFLRSPFVGLRDEVLARIRLEGEGRSLLRQARLWLEDGGDFFEAPEHPRVAAVERAALGRGLDALGEARSLSWRIPLDDLARLLLERTGYLAHLVVLGRHEEAVAHLHGFLHYLEAHRDRPLGRFLELWDRREETDTGVPGAPLHSREDDVVTFTTMHRAKGLEWPVVFLIDVESKDSDRTTNHLVLDRDLGPVLMPKQSARGGRAQRIADRVNLEEAAEEARVAYVALTRARERLVIVGELEAKGMLAGWLARGRDEAVDVRAPTEPRPPEVLPRPSLAWLDGEGETVAPPLVPALPRPDLRATTSATELMMKESDGRRWEMRYVHGVQPVWEFAPEPAGGAGGGDGAPVPAQVRGTLIHGVLERIEEARELAELLDETIGELDNPELEAHLSPGSRYREQLEREIHRVVESEEWAWYVEGEHHRELPFVGLDRRPWRLGSFDLYRPRDDGESWIVDFKTHVVGAEEVEGVAEKYRVQVEVYTRAAAVRGAVRMRLHFTHPNAVVEVGSG